MNLCAVGLSKPVVCWSGRIRSGGPAPQVVNNLSKAGWSLGWVSAIDSNGQTIWIADAHRGDGKRFVARADEKLTAFVELESAIRAGGFSFLLTNTACQRM
jgi:hypothetical protein